MFFVSPITNKIFAMILDSKTLRRNINRQRRTLSEQRRRQAATLASLYLAKLNTRLPKHAKVGLYLASFGELPTQPIVDWCKKMGYQPHLPVINSLGKADKRIRFIPIKHNQLKNVPTVKHSFGMQEPKQRHLLWAESLDVIICPLVAIDLQGNRMGMGGGFYDSTLAKSYKNGRKKPLRVGWCYEFQVVNKLNIQPWDVPMQLLITPEKFRVF